MSCSISGGRPEPGWTAVDSLTASVVQTVGSKGYDGFLLIRRRA